ncbi:MAG TPA: acyl-CoA thioesterase [Flavobacteriales bacterium]|jgi:acyl-CoA thioester hydrolase|nr:acyl-CoA thioesterase [Flavobacteriales bacterium]
MRYYRDIEIRFRDLDALGHVNNVVYLTYVEQSRIGYFNEVIAEKYDWTKVGVLLARSEINYLKPVVMTDTVKCGLECIRIGNKSLDFSFKIFRQNKDGWDEVASGTNVLVSYDHKINQSVAIPVEWKARIEDFEDEHIPL